jgi:hypothetical protein
MYRTTLINSFITSETTKYLEIGLSTGNNYSAIKCKNKTSADPSETCRATHRMTSDDFFAQNKETFDVIFIDGLHLHEQVYRDVINSLACLNPGGTIVCHDLIPVKEYQQLRTPGWEDPKWQAITGKDRSWTGDCWRAWVQLRSERSDLTMYAVDRDWGCGVIQVGSQETISVPKELTWEYFQTNKQWLLNISAPPAKVHTKAPGGIYTFIPYKEGGESFLDTCNRYMELLPNDDDFGIILDHDILFTTTSWHSQIQKAVEENPDVSAYAAATNRIWSRFLWADVDKDNNDVVYHRQKGEEIAAKYGSQVEDISRTDKTNRGWGGYFMMMRKRAWKKIGGFNHMGRYKKCMDWSTHEKLVAAGEKVMLLKGVYVYHWYSNFNPENRGKGNMKKSTSHVQTLFDREKGQ